MLSVGCIDEFAKSLGGQVTDMAVNAVLRHLGLEGLVGDANSSCFVQPDTGRATA